jgi:hypothetical protein
MHKSQFSYLPSVGSLSTDGLTYWNGAAWVSVVSDDGRYRWDGRGWRAAPNAASMSYGAFRMAINSLGIAGCLLLGLVVVDVALALGGRLGPVTIGVPWALILLVIRRAWKGRWLGAAILAVAWLLAVLILLLFGPPLTSP